MRAFNSPKELRSFAPDVPEELVPVLGEGDAAPDVILVKQVPTIWDMKGARPFLGPEGLPIRKAMLGAGIKFYSTHAFPFFHPKMKFKLDLGRQATQAYLEELRRVPTKKVILFGVEAVKLTPLMDVPFTKLSELFGRNIECGEYTFRVMPHPYVICNTPSLYENFIQSVEELVNPKSIRRAKPPKVESYMVHEDRTTAEKALNAMPARVACDVETTGLDPYTDRILTIQFSWQEGIGHAFPWSMFTPAEWAGYLAGKHLIFQNGTFDVKALANHGVYVPIGEDTMLMHSLIDETPGTHSMELMAQNYLGVDKWSDSVNYDDMEGNDLQTLGRYGARDTDLTLRLANVFRPLVKDRHIHKVLTDAQNAITRSELRGVRVNRDLAFQFQNEIEKAMHDRREYMADVHGLANPNSPKQVAELLYDKLGLPIQKDKGKVTTNSAALERFVDEYEVARDIMEYRHLTKANGTYIKNILETSERDGRYHPEFRLAATETGRLAEKLILLIPRADNLVNPDLGKQYQVRLRELFIPDDGYLMVGADYSGLEVGMAAHITQDPQLIKDVNDKLDTHSAVAIQAFGLDIPLEPYETLKKRVAASHDYQRTLAKQATFTWLYGGSEAAIARQLNVSSEIAVAILETLRNRYRGVAAWHERIREHVQKGNPVSTPWGRNRNFFFHDGLDRKVTEEQLRESTNSPIQGMSSDMTLAAFTQLENMGYQTLFPLHDAIYLQAPEDQVESATQTTKRVMESILKGPVPFRADAKWGPNWGALG